MKAKKVMALVLCAAMVSGLAATTVMAAPEDQFEGLTANEAYEFPMMVKSFQATYWEAAMKGMDKAAEELGVTYTAQGPNSESDIADQVNLINTAIAANPVGLGLAACDTSSVQAALQTCPTWFRGDGRQFPVPCTTMVATHIAQASQNDNP